MLCAICGERPVAHGDMCDVCWNELEVIEEFIDGDTTDKDDSDLPESTDG